MRCHTTMRALKLDQRSQGALTYRSSPEGLSSNKHGSVIRTQKKMNPMPFCRLPSHIGFKIVWDFGSCLPPKKHSLVGAQLVGLSTLKSNSSILPTSKKKKNESVSVDSRNLYTSFTDKKAGSTRERRDCFKLL